MINLKCDFRTLIFCLLFISLPVLAQPAASQARIDRPSVVRRHNPHVTRLDPLSALTVGNGHFAFTVDATGLQTFPEYYAKGVCLGTFSDWGWHSFPNTQGYQPEDAWVEKDFGRGHKEIYAAQFKRPGRQHDASEYLRKNPHRLHLGTVGLCLNNRKRLHDIDQHLDLWTGTISSRFAYGRQQYKVQTVCPSDDDLIATRIESNGTFALDITFAYPTGGHSDDARDLTKPERHTTSYKLYDNYCLITRMIDSTTYGMEVKWTGKAHIVRKGPHQLQLVSDSKELEVTCRWMLLKLMNEERLVEPVISRPFADWEAESAKRWQSYWQTGGFIDLGHVSDPRAKELERRVILSQYLMRAQECGPCPPQETGLTYNSWFGKFHLEMTWWHLAHWALWDRPELLDHPLSWYLEAEDKARGIARRQGFPGIRWMKMTDPWAGEAPSNVGSYLIWQQPHLIYLAELLRRAYEHQALKAENHDSIAEKKALNAEENIVRKYSLLVEETAEWMSSFAQWDSLHHRYVLRGCIPAQETLKADSTINPPFELNYWHTALQMAQQWRWNNGYRSRQDWDDIIHKLSPLAFNAESLYLAAESATDTYTNARYTSDHPALLGALGVLPESPLVNRRIMKKTLDWIWTNWHWQTSWGWDFPMLSMTCARLGEADRAVDALLMPVQKNTYLPQGHNYQDNRLRIYMPGNGGLLTAVAMMAAGWDGAKGHCPGFPKDWDVRYEDLVPMP